MQKTARFDPFTREVTAYHIQFSTMDFDGRFGATTGPWTTDMFVEAVYKSLKEKK